MTALQSATMPSRLFIKVTSFRGLKDLIVIFAFIKIRGLMQKSLDTQGEEEVRHTEDAKTFLLASIKPLFGISLGRSASMDTTTSGKMFLGGKN